MFIIKYKTYFLVFTALLLLASVWAMFSFGFHYAIDFTGGSLLEVEYKTLPVETMTARPSIEAIREALREEGIENAVIQPTGDAGVIIRARLLSDAERVSIIEALGGEDVLTEKRFDSIGPVIGQELRTKSLWGIALVILLIVLYITYAFRKVSKPVSSWKYGLIAVVTLVHDVMVPTGFYVIYGKYTGAEIDVLFVTALLAIIGFSIHDTIVVFDRIRENLALSEGRESFPLVVGKSLQETFTRSINTSLTVALTLLALIFVGSSSTVHFSWVLFVGILAGTYSSVFVASPLLVLLETWSAKRKA